MSESVGPDTGFKLFPLVKRVLDESSQTDIDALAAEVFGQVAAYDRDTALFQALRQVVRSAFRPPPFVPKSVEPPERPRPITPQNPPPERDGRQWLPAPTPAPVLVPAGGERDSEAAAVKPKPPPPRVETPRPARSPKVEAIRNAWTRAQMQRVSVGEGRQKFFGDCDIPDLEYMTRVRQSHIDHAQRRVDDVLSLTALMREQGYTKVSDVPASAVAGMSLAAGIS